MNSILLKKYGFEVVLFEEKKYPFHRVCGEYVSNEVVPFLKKYGLFPCDLRPAAITNFHLTSTTGRSFKMKLDLGGFGISRYVFDHWLACKAVSIGIDLREGERVTNVQFDDNLFVIGTKLGQYPSKVAIGSFGKRSGLDKNLARRFMQKRSPYVGVKYHIKTNEVPRDTVELHNFHRGYCGVSRINDEVFNLCYLTHRDNLRKYKEIGVMEDAVLRKNPHLRRIFLASDFLFRKPEVINEISFESKEPVFDHILMSGDSAGMITPLCGNGMAMAIHSARILCDKVTSFLNHETNRVQLENQYAKAWKSTFALRHWMGRKTQKLFGTSGGSRLAVALGKNFPSLARYLMRHTHGKPFN